jgi:hypothetical protein
VRCVCAQEKASELFYCEPKTVLTPFFSERILRHCGLWEGPIRTLANSRAPPCTPRRVALAASDIVLIPDAEFLEYQRLEGHAVTSRELQLVLDPEFL